MLVSQTTYRPPALRRLLLPCRQAASAASSASPAGAPFAGFARSSPATANPANSSPSEKSHVQIRRHPCLDCHPVIANRRRHGADRHADQHHIDQLRLHARTTRSNLQAGTTYHIHFINSGSKDPQFQRAGVLRRTSQVAPEDQTKGGEGAGGPGKAASRSKHYRHAGPCWDLPGRMHPLHALK